MGRLHRRDQAVARDRQVANPHAKRIEHGVGDRGRDRAVGGFAGAERVAVAAAGINSTSTSGTSLKRRIGYDPTSWCW